MRFLCFKNCIVYIVCMCLYGCVCVCIYTYTYIYCFYLGQRQSQPSALINYLLSIICYRPLLIMLKLSTFPQKQENLTSESIKMSLG